MHSKHKLGYANAKTGYYSHDQSLLPQVIKKISNAFRTMPGISFPVMRTIFVVLAPSVTKNMRYASKGPLILYALSQAVTN